MNLKNFLTCAVTSVLLAGQANAQNYDTNNVVVQTFAGSGFSGTVDGVGQLTMFNQPSQIVTDSAGNLFVAEQTRIRKITTDATVTTFAGGGGGSLPGYGTNVSLSLTPSGMVCDKSNILWIVQGSTSSLLRVGQDGYVSITNLPGISGTGVQGICVDSANNIYVSATYINKIFRWRNDGTVEVFVGSGNAGSADGNGIFTSFNFPAALAVDAADNIYVWDNGNYLVRRISQSRDVVTIAGKKFVPSDSDGVGTNATFSAISAMCVDASGNLVLACGTSIRRITATTNVTTLAGSFNQLGYTNGLGSLARFRNAAGVCLSQGFVFIADSADNRIRNLAFDPTAQVVLPANLQLNTYPGLQIIGTVGRTYQIQSSPDMTNWTTRATLLLTSSPYLWIDQNPVNGNKFYRAVLLP